MAQFSRTEVFAHAHTNSHAYDLGKEPKSSSLEVLIYQCINVSIGEKKSYTIPKLTSVRQKYQLLTQKVLRNLLSNMSAFIYSLEEMILITP